MEPLPIKTLTAIFVIFIGMAIYSGVHRTAAVSDVSVCIAALNAYKGFPMESIHAESTGGRRNYRLSVAREGEQNFHCAIVGHRINLKASGDNTGDESGPAPNIIWEEKGATLVIRIGEGKERVYREESDRLVSEIKVTK